MEADYSITQEGAGRAKHEGRGGRREGEEQGNGGRAEGREGGRGGGGRGAGRGDHTGGRLVQANAVCGERDNDGRRVQPAPEVVEDGVPTPWIWSCGGLRSIPATTTTLSPSCTPTRAARSWWCYKAGAGLSARQGRFHSAVRPPCEEGRPRPRAELCQPETLWVPIVIAFEPRRQCHGR